MFKFSVVLNQIYSRSIIFYFDFSTIYACIVEQIYLAGIKYMACVKQHKRILKI